MPENTMPDDKIGEKHEAAKVLGIPTCQTMHPDDPTPCAVCEPMFLSCQSCGEISATIAIAFAHQCDDIDGDEPVFTIKSEEEAF